MPVVIAREHEGRLGKAPQGPSSGLGCWAGLCWAGLGCCADGCAGWAALPRAAGSGDRLCANTTAWRQPRALELVAFWPFGGS